MKLRIFIFAVIVLSASMAGADIQITSPVIDLDFMRDYYDSRYDCGVGAMAELMAYWGLNGYSGLLRGGTFTGLIPDNGSAMINLHGYFLDPSNSGFNGSNTPPATLASYIQRHYQLAGLSVQVVRSTSPYWRDIVAELEAGRPVIMLLWGASHYVVAVGHTASPTTITFLWGHDPFVRTMTATQARALGPAEAWYVRPLSPPDIDPPPVVDPSGEPWYAAAMQWCNANGWELEPRD